MFFEKFAWVLTKLLFNQFNNFFPEKSSQATAKSRSPFSKSEAPAATTKRMRTTTRWKTTAATSVEITTSNSAAVTSTTKARTTTAAAPLDETHLDGVRGLILQRGFHPAHQQVVGAMRLCSTRTNRSAYAYAKDLIQS